METIYTTALSDQAQANSRDTRDLGREALETGQNYLEGAQKTGQQKLASVRSYAKDAANATGQKVVDIRAKADGLKNQGSQYIADQPVQAVLMAAAGGAALTALFVAMMRRSR